MDDDIDDDYLPTLEEIARARARQDEDEEWDGFSDAEPAEQDEAIPIYPEGGIRESNGSERLAPTVDDLHKAINNHGKVHGYAVNRHQASNYRNGKPTRYTIRGDRGGKPRQSTATIRNTSTIKSGCEFQGAAALNRLTGG